MPSLLASHTPSLPTPSLTFLLRKASMPDPQILHWAISQSKDIESGVDCVSRASAVNSMGIKYLFMINNICLHRVTQFSVGPSALFLTDSSSYLEQSCCVGVVLPRWTANRDLVLTVSGLTRLGLAWVPTCYIVSLSEWGENLLILETNWTCPPVSRFEAPSTRKMRMC